GGWPQVVGLSAGGGGDSAENCARARLAREQDRQLRTGQTRGQESPAQSTGGQTHAREARVRRSPWLQADVRRGAGVGERPDAERLRDPPRSFAGVAALRRAVGPTLDGRRAIRRRQPLV